MTALKESWDFIEVGFACLLLCAYHSSWDPRYACERQPGRWAQWEKAVALWCEGLSLTPTHHRRKTGMALCACCNSFPGGQRQVDPLWPASPAEKASSSGTDHLKAVESDRGRHLKSSSGLTCVYLFTHIYPHSHVHASGNHSAALGAQIRD